MHQNDWCFERGEHGEHQHKRLEPVELTRLDPLNRHRYGYEALVLEQLLEQRERYQACFDGGLCLR